MVRPLVLLSAWSTVAFAAGSPDRVQIRIDAARTAKMSIPSTIFGSFLEPIGNSTYNGLWAEILQNPSFESGLWSVENIRRLTLEQPAISRASQLGLPVPWVPLDPHQGNRYEPQRGDAANSFESLAIYGLADAETGVMQQVYLPVGRELTYRGSIAAKPLNGPTALHLTLRSAESGHAVLAQATVEANQSGWRNYEFQLQLKAGQVHSLEPVEFAIAVDGPSRILVDQALLTPADAVDGLDPEVVALAKAMHTPVVRYGGNFTSGYHWRDGVGPVDKRVSMRNIAWGIPEYNTFGTDEFLRFCQLIGAQPQIAVNLGSGTAQEAADWVRYVNEHWQPKQGLLWELGNELWGDWNLGYPTLQELPGRTADFSRAIRSVDPASRLIATGQDPDVYEKWNAAQLTNSPGTFNFLSTHFVVTVDRLVNKSPTADQVAEAAFALPVGLGRKFEAMQKQIGQAAKLAFTEWLFVSHTEGAPKWDNMGGAVAAGGIFQTLLQHSDIVPISDMTGILEFGGIWKKHGQVFATPAYYVFRMFATAEPDGLVEATNDAGTYDVHDGVTRLPEIPHVPYLETVAVLNKSRDRLTLFCVNRQLHRDLPAEINVTGFAPAGVAHLQTLAADSLSEVNSELEPEHVIPQDSTAAVKGGHLTHTFPRGSVTRIDFSR